MGAGNIICCVLIGIATAAIANWLGFPMAEKPVEYWTIFALGLVPYLVGKEIGKSEV